MCMNLHIRRLVMKNLKRVLKYIIVFAVFLSAVKITLIMQARMRKVRSSDSFYSSLDRSPLNVVMFYNLDKKMRKTDPSTYNHMKRANTILKELSRSRYYRVGDVQFISINVAKSDLLSLANSLNVKTFPTYILYKDDKAVSVKAGSARLTGFIGKQQLREFINKHFEQSIEKIIERKKELAELARLTRPYWGWYGGYGYPYWGWYGYPYRYGYYGYGPGFGISFGF